MAPIETGYLSGRILADQVWEFAQVGYHGIGLYRRFPWGNDEEGWRGDRYGGFTHPGEWRECIAAACGLLRHMLKAPAILVMVVES